MKYFFMLMNLFKSDIKMTVTDSLYGVIKDSSLSKDDYYKHLEEKYLN